MALTQLQERYVMVDRINYLTVDQAIKYCDGRRESAILTWVRKYHAKDGGLRKLGHTLMIAEWVLIEYKNSMRK